MHLGLDVLKIGKFFSVESRCSNDHFCVNVDVEQWSKKTKDVTLADSTISTIDDWSFNYQQIEDDGVLQNDGTFIKVTGLNPEVQDLFFR